MTLRLALIFALLLTACGPNTSRMTPKDSARTAPSAPADWPTVEAPSSVEASGSRDAALIVAIEDYTFLPDVPGAVANGEAWRTFLEDSVGVPRVYTLYDQKASREEMGRFAKRAAADVQPGGRLWFVFIGHGAPAANGEGLLVGMDAQQTVDSLAARSAVQANIVKSLQMGRASDVVMVVDACFSGRDSGGALLAKGSQPVVPVQAASVPSNVVVLSAAKANEFAGALPDVDRPAFSYLLLGAMRGWADDGDGSVTTGEAVEWTRAQLGHVTGRSQTPSLVGNGGVALTSRATEADPGIGSLMRGVRGTPAATAEAETPRIKGHDTGKGVAVPIPDGWYVHSSVPASYVGEDMTEVLRFEHDDGKGDFLALMYMKYGANHLNTNIKGLGDALLDAGARSDRQLAVRVGGRDGLRQSYYFQTNSGVPIWVAYEYFTNGEDMWFWMVSVHENNQQRALKALEFIEEYTEYR